MTSHNNAALLNQGSPSLLINAARQAAQADGVLQQSPANTTTLNTGTGMNTTSASASSPNNNNNNAVLQQARLSLQQQRLNNHIQANNKKKKGPPLRRGKWTPEEEAYAARLILEFKAGLLPLTDGTTLRTFLSKLLNCDPMRISKKFVGSNCIGKQVFRRRTADLNRLSPEQIQQSRNELSELERRFLERVAQTNRVKNTAHNNSAVAVLHHTTANNNNNNSHHAGHHHHHPAKYEPLLSSSQQQQQQQQSFSDPNNSSNAWTNPAWLQPPRSYKHGNGLLFSQTNLSNARAAAAGRALLGANHSAAVSSSPSNHHHHHNNNNNSLLEELQRRSNSVSSASNLLAQAVRNGSNAALQQLARNASAARFMEQLSNSNPAANSSMNSMLQKALSSQDQLHQLRSNNSLGNIAQRQNSFDALMSLDFQSLQSIDNLANLIQTSSSANLPRSGLKNEEFGGGGSANNNNSGFTAATSSGDLSAAARHLAASGRVESLLRNLNSQNSNANLAQLLQNHESTASLLAAASNSNVNLANLLRQDSSTGLSALRVQDGLSQRNSSVDDFLSLVAAGDIGAVDPSLLNVPMQLQQQDTAAKLLAQSQWLQSNASNANLASVLRQQQQQQPLSESASATALAMAQARAAAAQQQKRSLEDVAGDKASQGGSKRESQS